MEGDSCEYHFSRHCTLLRVPTACARGVGWGGWGADIGIGVRKRDSIAAHSLQGTL